MILEIEDFYFQIVIYNVSIVINPVSIVINPIYIMINCASIVINRISVYTYMYKTVLINYICMYTLMSTQKNILWSTQFKISYVTYNIRIIIFIYDLAEITRLKITIQKQNNNSTSIFRDHKKINLTRKVPYLS